jgi:glycosyltransferase involved in cell wall biosynthesis
LYEANSVDFLYQRYSRFNFTGVALSLLTGLPLGLEFNGSEVWVAKHWDPIGQQSLLERIERLNLEAADFIFVVSEVSARNLLGRGIDARRIHVNPNGVDGSTFIRGAGGGDVRAALGIDDRVVVGFLGTFGPWHGAPILARAAGLVSRHAGCHFLFVGDGDERPATEQIIGAALDGEHSSFVGRVAHDRIPAYLDACDILVAPTPPPKDGSAFFGSPTKLFEYMAMSRPVIASRLGQMADVIVDGENGVLVEAGDIAGLARAIELLAADSRLRLRLGDAARRTIEERYTWKHNAARVFEAVG